MSRVRALCLFLIALTLGACGTGPGQTIGCPETGQKATVATAGIAFTKGSSIYLVKPDGSNLRTLAGGSFHAWQPAWSHDGARIAFTRSRSDIKDLPQIYVMSADGQGIGRLTCDNKGEDSPTWSPDGTRIAYTRAEPDGSDSIVTMGADGRNPVVVVAHYDAFEDSSVAWSPDGQHIAYATKTGIVGIKPDGTGAVQLTTSPADFTVSWSPNSKWIAFTRGVAGSSLSQIWVMSATGGTPRRITTSGSYGSPTWSPGGLKLAFASQPDRHGRIYVSNADGSQLHAITPPLDDAVQSVAWSPAA